MKDVIKSKQTNEEYKLINGRRVKVNRRKRRSNLNNYYALAIVFATIIMLIMCMTVFFNAKKIVVNGVTLYSTEQILVIGGANTGDNLMRTNTDIIEKRLKDNLVYIDSVSVKKNYLSSFLEINITEAEKALDIKYKDKYYVLSKSGKILEAGNGTRNKKLPLVEGFELKGLNPGDKIESEDALKTRILQEMLVLINEINFKKINLIDITDRTDIKLVYDNRIDIELGSSVDMDYKLSYIKAVIDKSLSDTYEGTLKYNGMNSGISAIPKSADSSVSDPTSKSDSSFNDLTENSEYDADTQASQAQTWNDYNTNSDIQENTGDSTNYDYDVSSQTQTDVDGTYNGWQ